MSLVQTSKKSATTEHLKSCGAKVWYGHASSQVNGADVVVMSPAIPEDNPELQAAMHAKSPLYAGQKC